MRLFIRPCFTVLPDNRERLLSLAVCTTNGEILIDDQIKEHFPADATGKQIKAEFPEADWGDAIRVQ